MSSQDRNFKESDNVIIPLDILVTFFVAAKKSLAATSHVYLANEIVEDGRSLIEEIAVLRARNAYVRSGLQQQVHVLQNIYGALDAVAHDAQSDFQFIVKSLDVANDRLQATLGALRKTVVSSSLKSTRQEIAAGTNDQANKELQTDQEKSRETRTLYDFIDESSHAKLLDDIRSTIDTYNDAQASLYKVKPLLKDILLNIKRLLDEYDKATINKLESSDIVKSEQLSISSIFQSLTTHASEMATLLESLISHYDLCITALKHTEGGGEAAAQAATNMTTISGTESPHEASLYADPSQSSSTNTRPPISNQERKEMLTVLSHDASQVDEVVFEIRDHVETMTLLQQQLTSFTTSTRDRSATLSHVLTICSSTDTMALLSRCTTSPSIFLADWSELKNTLTEKTTSLLDLAGFYEQFIASYAALLREVDRRSAVEDKMRRIMERAKRDIDALRQEDEDMRREFIREVGEYLPRDIWDGFESQKDRDEEVIESI